MLDASRKAFELDRSCLKGDATRSDPASLAFFYFAYAVLYSPAYRHRYADFLKSEFPRIPVPKKSQLIDELVELGSKLVTAHLMESPSDFDVAPVLVGSRDFQVEKVSYSDETVWINRAKTHGFQGVPEAVWNFHIGGYQICEKWLKDRQAKNGKEKHPGRVLTDDDLTHFKKIVVALRDTLRLMKEIDEVVERHGGWPGAFQIQDSGDQ